MREALRQRLQAWRSWVRKPRFGRPALATVAALAICAVGYGARVWIAADDTESPLMDEKEVTEQAVAFLGGDLRYYFLRYGPLTMYVLAGIYRVVAWAHGLTPLDYAARVFFDGGEHYFIARAYVSFTLTVCALLAYFHFRKHHGVPPALLASALLGLPFLDILVFGVRIDVAQTALQGMTLLALGEVVRQPRLRYWAAAGACAGFAIATKPLPGAMILPVFVLASWAAARSAADGTRRSPRSRLGATFASPGPWVAALACVACACIGNPAMLDIRTFIESQRETMDVHSGGVSFPTNSIPSSFLRLGQPFVVALAVSIPLVLWRRDPQALLALAFMVMYIAPFVGRASRHYYMVPAAMAGALVVAHGLAAFLHIQAQRRPRWRLAWLTAPLVILLVNGSAQRLWARTLSESNATQALRWFHENVPPGTGVIYVGRRPFGPRLVATDEQLHRDFSHSFHYGRGRYRFLKAAYRKAYADYVASGRPRYVIEPYTDKLYPRGDKRMSRRISDSLLNKAKAKKQRYVVLVHFSAHDVRDLGYKWFNKVTLEKQFGSVAIFRIKDGSTPAAPAKAAPDAAAPATSAANAATPAALAPGAAAPAALALPSKAAAPAPSAAAVPASLPSAEPPTP